MAESAYEKAKRRLEAMDNWATDDAENRAAIGWGQGADVVEEMRDEAERRRRLTAIEQSDRMAFWKNPDLQGPRLPLYSDNDIANTLDYMQAGPAIGSLIRKAVAGGAQTIAKAARPHPIAPRPDAMGLYSKLEHTIESKMGGSATPEQIRGMLREVKPEEMEWTRVEEILKGKDRVSKDELLAHVKSNRPKISEVVYGGGGTVPNTYESLPGGYSVSSIRSGSGHLQHAVLDPDGKVVGVGTDLTDAIRDFHRVNTQAKTKYGDYTLPGGDNYREVLVTLPTDPKGETPAMMAEKLYGKKSFLDLTKEQQDHIYEIYQEQVKEGERQLEKIYKSSHWEEPNVLAHYRLKDRIDADGKKTLFVEEVQSDWHQEGRKKGYIDKNRKDITELPAGYKIEEYKPEIVFGNGEGQQGSYWNVTSPEGRQLLTGMPSKAEATERALAKINREAKTGGVPDAPFKKTWHELAMKRIMKQAADEGYDRVAWATGAQNAEHYNLTNHISEINYSPFHTYHPKTGKDLGPKPGAYNISIIGKDGRPINGGYKMGASESDIEELLGKEYAKKIASGEGVQYGEKGGKSLKGLNLEVGGEGMKGFYDKMLPDYVNKVGKKYGSKVVKTEIQSGSVNEKFDLVGTNDGKWRLVDKSQNQGQGTYIGPVFRSGGDAEAWLKSQGHLNQSVHSIDITPEMRKSIKEEGFPLFQIGGAAIGAGTLAGTQDASADDHINELLDHIEGKKRDSIEDLLDHIEGKRK